MKTHAKGFTLLELIIALSITLIISASSGAAIFQIFGKTDLNNSHLTAVRQAENAGFWITRDAQRAQNISTENLTFPDMLVMTWTEWDANGNPTYHSARYSFDNITSSIGQLKRNYSNSAGVNQQTLVGVNIYYNPGDSENSSSVSYQKPVLTLRLTAVMNKARETREFRIARRPNM